MSKSKYNREFKHAVIATDIALFSIKEGKLHVLLIEMKKPEYKGKWALPGGLVDVEEGLENAARRHLDVKTGVKQVYLEQLETFGDPKRDPFGRVVSVAYFALISWDKYKLSTSSEYGGVAWFSIDKLPKLAYDHNKIIITAIDRLKTKLMYTNIVYGLLPKSFTLTQLQDVYELILDETLDKRNFRKKILSLDIVKETKGVQTGQAFRPAQLYTFISNKPKVIEML